ncbi:hypothetical protein JCM19233_1924 [Vibrio astriarenae]|nr:hypothetical protein JCM19233_1924 [Vibrio sp. C7]
MFSQHKYLNHRPWYGDFEQLAVGRTSFQQNVHNFVSV